MPAPHDDDTQAENAPSHPEVRTAGVHSYQLGLVLGRGGMGEVVQARDPRLGRDVALKRMRSSAPSPDALARFEREAKIQARLDHPAIVPVHEIGVDDRGEPYFTMKLLAGRTLADVLAAGTERPQRLLRALVDVCRAIDLAHAKQIVHRDLKPANIMLGNYGEVYVLDWGVARILDASASIDPEPDVAARDEVGTQTGALVGTPGYMAPEQVGGEPPGPAADVYALGAILFELLAGARLHPTGLPALTTTLELTAEQASPARRRPDRAIAPELDAACVAALAPVPEDRPTARDLAERLERYLDGDRDLEARRALAAGQLATANAALHAGRRADAVHHAGRAIALDPSSIEALGLLTSLIVEPPRELPDELARALAHEEEHQRRVRSGRAVAPPLAVFLLVPFGAWLGIQSWLALALVLGFATLNSLVSYVNARIRPLPIACHFAGQFVFATAFAQLAGPLIATPALIAAMLLGLTAIAWIEERPWWVYAWTVATATAPLALEALGLVPTTAYSVPGAIVSTGNVFRWSYEHTYALVMLANVVMLLLVAAYGIATARDRRRAQRSQFIQAWHLAQLLPRA